MEPISIVIAALGLGAAIVFGVLGVRHNQRNAREAERQKEIELTPEIKKEVREAIDASPHDVDFDLVCYYIRFGIDAPQPPKLSEEGRAWLKQLKKSASS